MKLTNLSGWYKAIKNQNLTYNVYECKYNHIDFSILFDIGKTPFILSLIKRQTGEVITFNILQGFLIETNLPHDQYYLLRKILNIPDRGESPFSTMPNFLYKKERTRYAITHPITDVAGNATKRKDGASIITLSIRPSNVTTTKNAI